MNGSIRLEKNFKVMEIGQHFVIKPSWTDLKLDYPGRVIIEMDPGAAFGTGLHPTTRLCLLNLHKYLKPGMTVFDLGTGTGILAIAAVKLGAASVMAFDLDNVAVKTAQSNCQSQRGELEGPIQTGHSFRPNAKKISIWF